MLPKSTVFPYIYTTTSNKKVTLRHIKHQIMETSSPFTATERNYILTLYKRLLRHAGHEIPYSERQQVKHWLRTVIRQGAVERDVFSIHPLVRDLEVAHILTEEMNLRRAPMLAVLLQECVKHCVISIEEVEKQFGKEVATIIGGLIKINALYAKTPVIETENFRNLLLSFAQDMRVILIMIADRVNLMRSIKDAPDLEAQQHVAREAEQLYAPLAHKLGLYQLKSELEDLSLKYLSPEMYYHIKEKLNATKQTRDAYIEAFIAPIEKKLAETGLKYHIKGRTKSIHSIYQKMRKQKCPFEGVYDLFAIRIILDSAPEKEKQECWQVYSIVTDMYLPNPKRLRDWLSVPKSNGYESLHITVMGTEGKWVEVQIRTERMDEVAEKGFAAHWRYKGIKGEQEVDTWLNSIRETLESADSNADTMSQFKMELYKDEVFIFTPNGDLFRLPQGATVLDFAFTIHTNLGSHCIGAKVNGKNAQLRQVLNSGDQVEVMTSTSQTPKRDWLAFTTTSKARSKIRQALKEMAAKQGEFIKETLERKFKNRKIEFEEALLMRLIRKMGFKAVTDFYQSIAIEELDINSVIERYVELQKGEADSKDHANYRSAENFSIQQSNPELLPSKDDVLVIDQNIKGLDFQLSRCCTPIYGDDIFGFVTISGGVKVHRTDCPNAKEMRSRFPYRILKARWAGKSVGKQYPIALRIVGHDDIGIVTNITSIINKEANTSLRSINIQSHDGLFTGALSVLVDDTSKLNALIKKLRTVKGVKQVSRS